MRNSLTQKGWQIVAEHPGNDYDISGSWEIRRGTSLLIDFGGMDKSGDACLPISRSYSCRLRGRPNCGVYFGKNRKKWASDLKQFILALDSMSALSS
ncbi:MAG TPA: hypothetical protein VKI17_00610 [Gemmataceae bacterium]|nr:hypothetical protein [Gemmataceae bacterium]